jgi:hypothetical protein
LKLVVWGTVLRSERGRIVIAVKRHEFRTARKPLARAV